MKAGRLVGNVLIFPAIPTAPIKKEITMKTV